MFLYNKNCKTNRILSLFPILLMIALLLTSCHDAEAAALETYKNNMSVFFDNVTNLGHSIDAIDKNEENATQTFLSLLDELGQEFESLREFDIPDDFSSITDITVDAADSMKKAVELYHKAYGERYDAAAEADAYSYYERASRCIRVIMQVLNGESPSVEGVTYQ